MQKKDLPLDTKWELLLDKLNTMVGKRPENVDAVLFLIGIQELGQGTRQFSKEQKQDLMHIATCRILSKAGIYELEGIDQDGWPHWKLKQKIPQMDLEKQEQALKMHIIEYFEDEGLF